jgi:hypothetical protein
MKHAIGMIDGDEYDALTRFAGARFASSSQGNDRASSASSAGVSARCYANT